jgi:hypothetical protein
MNPTERKSEQQKVQDRVDERAQQWKTAADRAEIRNQPALARYFRNQAWIIVNGKNWLDDVTISAAK